ncbi:MAG: hypothetical protein SFY69_12770 [Planctomycetota bacterium]|nr:hypothetical protein [Planctomycetota bacterium]
MKHAEGLRARAGGLVRSHYRVAILSLLLAAGVAHAQPGGQAASGAEARAQEADRQRLLADFIHYVRIQRYDLAEAMARQILDLNLDDRAFVDFVERSEDPSRAEDAWQRAIRVQQLQDVAARMMQAYQSGRVARARDPQEIETSIKDLTDSTLRGKLLARQRLLAAGEYAMPQLLAALLSRENPARRAEVRQVMIELGRQAIMPLSAVLPELPPVHQEQIADVLGVIPWRSSLPVLADVASTTQSEPVRSACNRAIERLGGTNGLSVAQLYTELGEAYYDEKPETVSFPGESHQLLWSFDGEGGLAMTAIVTPVYHEAVAMRLAERAMRLEADPGSADTLALWVAANFSREIDSPEGYVNPAYATSGTNARRGAEYYGVAGGADVATRVLARAIDDRDTPLARRALAAVERTAGGKSAGAGLAGRTPLIEALTYPNRRVQYEAALAIGASQPDAVFAGSDRVVPVLASTVREAAVRHAAVIAQDAESYQNVRRVLERLGYSVMPQGRSLADLEAPIAEAPAVDMVVSVGLNAERFPQLVEAVKGTTKLAATPVLGITGADAYSALRNRYDVNSGVAVRVSGRGDDAVAAAITELANISTGGPITDEEARAYRARSLGVLRDLAVSNNPVLNVADAALPLVGALADGGESRLDVAEILSRIGQERCQRALADAALDASGSERVALLEKTSQSARQFGNLLEQRHLTRILEVASSGAEDEAVAAAALLGSLGVSNTQIRPLILGGR